MKLHKSTHNCALILIDIQNDYFQSGNMALHNMEKSAQNASKVLKFFRENHFPIFHIQHISTKPNATFFLPNTFGAEIHSLVTPLASEKVIQKNYPNSFRNTNLLQELQQNHIEKLFIVGAMTHMCIDATTRAAWDLGFSNIVIADACATRNLEYKGIKVESQKVHAAFLSALHGIYADVLNLNELSMD